jgi:hypothetical protein
VTDAGTGPCQPTYEGCEGTQPDGCGGDPNSPSYAIKTLGADTRLPVGCTVRTFDEARNVAGQCIFQESCTCIAADGGGSSWACAP